MMNPYFGVDGWHFFTLFFSRLGLFLTGQLGRGDLAADEVQIYVLFLLAFSCALVGCFLVLKKMTMLANSLSHTILPGLVVAYLVDFALLGNAHFSSSLSLSHLLIASVLTALMTVFATQLFHQSFRLQEEASVALVCTAMTAIGVVLVTVFTRNIHLGVEAVMGNVDALQLSDLGIALWVAVGSGVGVICFFKELQLVAFDPGFARVQGFSERAWNYFLLFLTALTVVGAFRAVGMLLVLSLLVGPVLTARLFTHRMKPLILSSMAIGMGVSFLGVLCSRHCLSVYHIPLSTSGIISSGLGLVYFLFLSVKMTLQKLQGAGKLRALRNSF